jgi:predicted transcriptional regulator
MPNLTKPGRPRVGNAQHRRRRLSSDAAVMKALLEKQPQTRAELCKNTHMPVRSSYHTLPFLESLGIIKEIRNGYALKDYDETEAEVVETLERWRRISFRNPLPAEIAVEVGITPEAAEKLAYKCARQTGWFSPGPELIQESREKLGEILVYAARLRAGEAKDYCYGRDRGIVKEAKRFLKEHPKMVPKRPKVESGEIFDWPPEALKYLGQLYKPKGRGLKRGFIFGPPIDPWRRQRLRGADHD